MAEQRVEQNSVRVAVTQAEPEWLDLQASVAKTCKLIAEAASQRAELVSFPECWIPGYPAWIWSRLLDFEMICAYQANSLAVASVEMKTIQACAKDHQITVALSFAERSRHSLYISQCTISDSGEILMLRRKLMPTHMERTVFGNSSGSSLTNVVSTKFGQLGQLACWEHAQPLLKYHTITQNETCHVAAWPPVHPFASEPDEVWSMSKEGMKLIPCPCPLAGNKTDLFAILGTQTLSRAYAIEAGSFVLHTTAVITQKGIDRMNTKQGPLMSVSGGGSSAIFGPDGRKLSTDIPDTEEGIIYADLSMSQIFRHKALLDVIGHYSRPDLLWLGVDKTEKVCVRPFQAT
ncbi:carbon-nitrogen hydrolase [Aureobasidium pullulans]|nr:carbon-nitrogen hydrolase [Aureobasidium pullulans]